MTIAGEFVASVIETLVINGMKRGYREIKTAVRRRHVIDRAISGSSASETDDRLRKAIRDLEIVIGSARGELTEAVAAFIREIEKSAIPESLVRCVLTNSDPAAIYPAFELVYMTFSGTVSFDPKNFFDALFVAVKLRTEQQVKDPGLLEFVQAQNKELARQLAEVSRALRATGEPAHQLTSEEIAIGRVQLARSFEAANRFLTVETVQGAKRCRIKQLVVPPRLATVSISKKRATRKALPEVEETQYTPYLQFKVSISRAVILGDPGGGKSTLTQLLCFDNSNSIILEASFPGKPQIDPAELRIPFRIILRSFDKRRQTNPGYSLFTYLHDEIKEIFDDNHEHSTKLLRHFLTLGNALLVFDGLDEILEIDRRREIVALIEQFTSKYAACPSIVTSRFVGYWDAPLSEEFFVCHLASFDDDEVATFAYKFIKIIETLKKPEAEKRASRFLTQTNNVASDLRENPLMLGLMVYLFMYRGDVPSNRPEIYKECDIIKEKMRGVNFAQRAFSMFIVCVDYEFPYMRKYFDAPGPAWETARSNGKYFEPVRRDLREYNGKRALTSSAEARLFLFTYAERHQECFDRFAFDALYCDGPVPTLKEIPDIVQLVVCEVALAEDTRRTRRTTDFWEAATLLDTLFKIITSGNQVRIPGYTVAASEDIAEAAIHTIYDLATRYKKPNVEFIIKALLVFALSMDIGNIVGRPRKGEQKQLISVMPPEAMEEMLSVINEHPLSALLEKWNDRQLSFATKE